jgi:hypothetical protein
MPNISSPEGLLDVIMVGNTLEFAFALNRHYTAKQTPPDVAEEQHVAMYRYRLFQSWYNRNYILNVEGQYLSPSYVFNRSLITFGAALCSYFR